MDKLKYWVVVKQIVQFLGPQDRKSLRGTCRYMATRIHTPRPLEMYWKIEPARDHATHCKGLRIWGMDAWSHKRQCKTSRFLVGTLASFLKTMNRYEIRGEQRCFYEIIHSPGDGLKSETWTNAYLDLEFHRPGHTSGKSDEEILKIAVKSFKGALRREVGVGEKADILPIQTTAHKSSKFSAHVVFRIAVDGMAVVFPDNFSVGAVVRKWEYDHQGDKEVFYYLDADKEVRFIADGGVYTLRRQFRTMDSTKFREERYLRPTDPETTLAQSMVQYHDYGTSWGFDTPFPNVLTVTELDGTSPVQTSVFWERYLAMKKPGKRMSASRSASDNKKSRVEYTPRGGDLLSSCCDWLVSLDPGSSIRGVSKREDSCLFDMDSRMCRIRKRNHFGNHIYYTIRIGDMFAVQYCHDGDCVATGIKPRIEMPPALKEHMNLASFFQMTVENILTK